MRNVIIFLLVLAAAGALAIGSKLPQTRLAAKAAIDQTVRISDSDTAMIRAVEKARQSLPQFLAAAAHPDQGSSGFAVKTGLGPQGAQEFVWINQFSLNGGKLTGRLANTPESVLGYSAGQSITIPISDVTDWMYYAGTKMQGNYTACALATHASESERAEFEAQYGIDCATR
jgi:uncharacterized protein YegJ (DUF2314 family)